VDVTQNESGLCREGELPGVAKEDIAGVVEGGEVSISAEVKREKETKEGDKVCGRAVLRLGWRAPSRCATDVDSAKARRSSDNGVLTLTLPKAEGARSKTLPVQ